MFNGGRFNNLSYNRPFAPVVPLQLTFNGVGLMDALASGTYTTSAVLYGQGDIDAKASNTLLSVMTYTGTGTATMPLFNLKLGVLVMEGEGLALTEMTRTSILQVAWVGEGEMGGRYQQINETHFNNMAFNRRSTPETQIKVTRANAEFAAKGTFWGEGELLPDIARITSLPAAAWDGVGNATLPIGKLAISAGTWYGQGGIRISNDSFNIFIMEYDGVLSPGERITLNTERFTLKKNNEDVLELLNGDFVDLKTGINEVVIESDTGTRTLLIRVEHRDRWV